jgi:hypothetical protein
MRYEVRVTKHNKSAITAIDNGGQSKRLLSTETDHNGAEHVVKILNYYEEQIQAMKAQMALPTGPRG